MSEDYNVNKYNQLKLKNPSEVITLTNFNSLKEGLKAVLIPSGLTVASKGTVFKAINIE